MAGGALADARTGRNGCHTLVGLLRQSVFGRLAGYEDFDAAERLRQDSAMRSGGGGKATSRAAAPPSQVGRFEMCWLTSERSLLAPPLLLRLTRNNILTIPVTADALDIAAAKLPPGLRIEGAPLP
jgi:Transposase DDE domain group 1